MDCWIGVLILGSGVVWEGVKWLRGRKSMKLSLVTPVYNEEESLPLLYDAVQQALTDFDEFMGDGAG